ncbi:site-specific integrase [Vibrio splendidus]|uniref:site-specific integrase n=1 Tax=Vibrio splendidus TaxID=29497 RepID=UPI000C82289C|nr:site-specific integrase [Vibrio splendidus]PMI28459.1 hypothetical protein BCU48_15450 [Vibrio splendidus]PMM33787.1 hypothetical protein BCT55_20120 [Vibrio splendidus]PMO39208.1 hypothetical protein BCT09_07100 [Vibrio splendidus]PTP59984.1 hypothetical protein CWO31_22680 [Vibrio splendidus]
MSTLTQQSNIADSTLTMLTVDRLKKYSYQEKMSLSIGEYNGKSLGNYSDDEWLFYLLEGSPNQIISSVNLNFSSVDKAANLAKVSLKNTECYTVKEAARDCLWLRYQDGISVRTLNDELRAWKFFHKWWVEKFDGMDFEQWLSSPILLERYLHWAEKDFRDSKKNKVVSKKSQRIRLQPLFQLYSFRSLLRCGLSRPPFGGKSAAFVVGPRVKYQQTALIEESQWVQIVQTAWEIVNTSDSVIESFVGYWGGDERYKLERELTRDGNKPSKSTISDRLSKYLLHLGYDSYSKLEHEIILFEASSIVLILALTGMRQSELAGLQVNCYQEKESDFSAIHFKTSYLQGRTYKYSYFPEGEQHLWLVPSVMKTVISKVNKLNHVRRLRTEHYLEKHMQAQKYERLCIEAKRSKQSLFVLPGVNARHNLSLRLNQLTIKRRVDTFMGYLSNEHGVSAPMRVTPHMFRRTFARFIAISPLGSVEALRDQFGHRTGDITEYYTQGGDEEILNWILEDQSSFQQAVIETQINHNDDLHGGLGDAVASEEFASRDFHTSKNLKTLRKKVGVGMEVQLNAHSVSVRPVDKGACANNCRLNRVQCISCENCVITPAQLPFWEDQLSIMEACAKEGIVQGIDKVRELVSQLKEDVRESAATAE